MEILLRAEGELPAVDSIEVPSRIVHLPLSWEDESTLLAIRKYMQIVRKDAPWCPSNIEFIRRINGLDSVDEVHRIAFEASYLVLALGDVYLGAPVATPVDPRHRLVTTKYNPARTWTPENAVGIGGAYLCVYGMEGPGGYQFIGRTCQMWNRYKQTVEFTDGKPWLLRFFDQIRFYPVIKRRTHEIPGGFSAGESAAQDRGDHVPSARLPEVSRRPTTRPSRPSRRTSRPRLKPSANAGKRAASSTFPPNPNQPPPSTNRPSPPAARPCRRTSRATSGKSWSRPAMEVKEGDPLVILESMKMEVTIVANRPGKVREVRCVEGRPVNAGETLVVLES